MKEQKDVLNPCPFCGSSVSYEETITEHCIRCTHCGYLNTRKTKNKDDDGKAVLIATHNQACARITDLDDTVTVSKTVFLTLMNLLSLSAFSITRNSQVIFEFCDLGKNEEMQAEAFSHKKNYDRIRKYLSDMCYVNRIVFNAIPTDDISISECVKNVIKDKQFKKMLKYYGADLASNGNFNKI